MPQTSISNGRLVAVVVTFQRLAHIRVTLTALLAQPETHLAAVIVVDNATTDGTAAFLARLRDPRLTVVRTPRNLGGAGGFGLGMQHALRDHAPDWLVLMDDDARPQPSAMTAFHALDLSAYDGLAAAVRLPDGQLCELNRPTLNPFRHVSVALKALLGGGREAFHLREADFARPGLRPIDGASFVGFFLRADVARRHGLPDASLFIYGEDAIYTHSLTRAGYRLGFDPSVAFEHDNSSYSRQDPRIKPLWKVYYHHRNLLILYRQLSGLFFAPVLCIYLPRWLWRLRAHRGERAVFLRLFMVALGDGLRQHTHRPHEEILAVAHSTGQGIAVMTAKQEQTKDQRHQSAPRHVGE